MRPALPTFVAILLGMLAFERAGAQVVYPDFSTSYGITSVGDAFVTGGRFRLTESAPNRRGAFWSTDRQRVGLGFTTRFRFRMSDPLGEPDIAGERGGDGLAFVIQTEGNRALGGTGGMMGYHGINRYVAIEFDTYLNGSVFGDPLVINDSSSNHISVQPNDHRSRSTLGSVKPPSNFSDGQEHEVLIEYRPGRLRIFLDGCSNLILTVPLQLGQHLSPDAGGMAWVGFTAATGTSWENHDIISWYFNPELPDSTIQVTICPGSSALLRGPNTAARHIWSTGATTPDLIVDRPGTYWVDLNDTLGCSISSSRWRYVVTERVLPRPLLSHSDTVVSCGSGLVVSVNPAFQRYRWSNGGTGRTQTILRSGTYWVHVTDETGCMAFSDTLTVKVLDRPKVRITALDPPRFCQGDSVRLDGGAGFSSYRWSTGDTTRSITVGKSLAITLTVTDSLGCDSTTSATVVGMIPPPLPRISIRGNSSPCRSDSVILDAGDGYGSYRWSTGDTTSTIVVRRTSSVSVRVRNADGCEGTSPEVQVTIGRELPAPEITADGPLSICSGGLRRLSAPAGFASYLWNTGETTPSIDATSAGLYTVTVFDASGCEATSTPTRIVVTPEASLDIAIDGSPLICAGETRTLTATPGMAMYRWSNGSDRQSITITAGGRYIVQGIDSMGCSATPDTLDVTVGAPLSLSIDGAATICAGESAALSATGSGGIGRLRYQWSPSAGLSCTDCAQPVATPAEGTLYTLVVTDEAGCSTGSTVRVDVTTSPARIAADMGNDLFVLPGRRFTVPVQILGSLHAKDAHELLLTIRYSGSPIRLVETMTRGTLTEGWVITLLDRSEGFYKAVIETAPRQGLTDTGRLLELSFEAFLGSSRDARISFDLELPGVACTIVETMGTTIRIDSVCGIDLRLIEMSGRKYSLAQNAPNPVSSTTRIPFTIGLDGVTTLEVIDASGNRVALLVESHLLPGEYEVTWDATAFPSGIYTCVLRSGAWSGITRIAVVR